MLTNQHCYHFVLVFISSIWFVNILLSESFTQRPFTFYYSISQIVLNTVLMILLLNYDSVSISIMIGCIEYTRRLTGLFLSDMIFQLETTKTPLSLLQESFFGFLQLSYGHFLLYVDFFISFSLVALYSVFGVCLTIFLYRVKEQNMEMIDQYTEHIEQPLLGHECSICLESISCGVKIRTCQHVFHRECLQPWLTKEFTCPLCRNYVFLLKTVSVESNSDILP
jgi:hypothetical protein